ncbi:protein kinase domain protein [Ichthyophthirius multifiliis]|uniref:Protein kinase domain protein n=1 Tax=Ichthyophthirius multifiliis TaxID=5932 RepID=G0QZY6_ICHMU|nr:protein kinase domain protein [Ichthyophthirius multifiliis]EGR29219.1 protein kinase domain protein [Ichthyophthirius multifiliis]|eukprot:XP_004030455.1 protein kinase domain protein [Ichthyophthirius multifiliis]
MLCITKYSTKIDIWSFGCILGELVTNKLLFKGKNEGDQLIQIFRLLGFLNQEEYDYFSQKVPFDSKIFEEFQIYEKQFSHLEKSDLLLDLLQRCLQFCPEKRISACEALNHPLFQEIQEKYS